MNQLEELEKANHVVHVDRLDECCAADYFGHELSMSFVVEGLSGEPFMLTISGNVLDEMHRRMVDAMDTLLSGAVSKEAALQVTTIHRD